VSEIRDMIHNNLVQVERLAKELSDPLELFELYKTLYTMSINMAANYEGMRHYEEKRKKEKDKKTTANRKD